MGGLSRTQGSAHSAGFGPQMCQLLPLNLDTGSEGGTTRREASYEHWRGPNLSDAAPSATEGIHFPSDLPPQQNIRADAFLVTLDHGLL